MKKLQKTKINILVRSVLIGFLCLSFDDEERKNGSHLLIFLTHLEINSFVVPTRPSYLNHCTARQRNLHKGYIYHIYVHTHMYKYTLAHLSFYACAIGFNWAEMVGAVVIKNFAVHFLVHFLLFFPCVQIRYFWLPSSWCAWIFCSSSCRIIMKVNYFFFLALAFTLFTSSCGHFFRNNDEQQEQVEQVSADSSSGNSGWLRSKIVAPLVIGKFNELLVVNGIFTL